MSWSRRRWAYRAVMAIAKAGVAYTIVQLLQSDLETLIGCSAGLIYLQVHFTNGGLQVAVQTITVLVAQRLPHPGEDNESRKDSISKALHDAEEGAYGFAAEAFECAILQIVFAWLLVKLFWARLNA